MNFAPDPDRSVLLIVSAASALELQAIAFAGVAVKLRSAVTIEDALEVSQLENEDPRAKALIVVLRSEPRTLKALLEVGLYLSPKKPVHLSAAPTIAVTAPRKLWAGSIAPADPVTWKELYDA